MVSWSTLENIVSLGPPPLAAHPRLCDRVPFAASQPKIVCSLSSPPSPKAETRDHMAYKSAPAAAPPHRVDSDPSQRPGPRASGPCRPSPGEVIGALWKRRRTSPAFSPGVTRGHGQQSPRWLGKGGGRVEEQRWGGGRRNPGPEEATLSPGEEKRSLILAWCLAMSLSEGRLTQPLVRRSAGSRPP
jgi:hypothetical protein